MDHDQILADKLMNPLDARPQDLLKLMDTSYEGFFAKREINTKNFNLLILALADQKKFNDAVTAFEQMTVMNIRPTNQSYVNMLSACAKSYKIQEADL